MNVHYLQHEPFEGLGSMGGWFEARGARVTATHLYREGPVFPDLAQVDCLVIMGGGMSVNDGPTLPWLVAEMHFVRRALEQGKIMIGVCLGAQMIAAALGAKVYPNPVKEIGWFPITREPASKYHPVGRMLPLETEVFHWHGETFDLPCGAVRLARSAACLNQAFSWGDRTLALQFHLEVTAADARGMIAGAGADLQPGPSVQTPEEMLARPERFVALNALMGRLLDQLIPPE